MISLPALSAEDITPVLDALPPLPNTLKYWDDFLLKHHTIKGLAATDHWNIKNDGENFTLSFDYLPNAYRPVIKLVAVEQLSRLDTSSALTNMGRFRGLAMRFGPKPLLNMMLGLSLYQIRDQWLRNIQPNCTHHEAMVLKNIVHSFCIQGLGPWRPDLRAFARALPTPPGDLYRRVRSGNCFLPLNSQSLIIDHFDEIATLIAAAPAQVETAALRDICMLMLNHQHALRRGQIARLTTSDVRLFETGAVHFSFVAMKQRRSSSVRSMTRRVKREWCPVFIEYDTRRRRLTIPEGLPKNSYFGLTPQAVGKAIESLVTQLTGQRWSSTDLRHSAAQRLVDAGASHEVLAEYMSHASIRTANVYFDTSPAQAQRVNQALGLSPIYGNVAEVARTRTIDKTTLLRLPPEKQLAGVPHGIPIAGIGGCAAGQPVCSKNPILSCYSCRKFMPVNDATVHDAVVESLRPVVLEFADASRGNEESPAYTQLRRTLRGAQQVAAAIKNGESLTAVEQGSSSDE